MAALDPVVQALLVLLNDALPAPLEQVRAVDCAVQAVRPRTDGLRCALHAHRQLGGRLAHEHAKLQQVQLSHHLQGLDGVEPPQWW